MKIVNTEITYVEKNFIVSVDDGEREIKCRVNVFDYTGKGNWMINTIVAYDTSKADKKKIKQFIINNFKPSDVIDNIDLKCKCGRNMYVNTYCTVCDNDE